MQSQLDFNCPLRASQTTELLFMIYLRIYFKVASRYLEYFSYNAQNIIQNEMIYDKMIIYSGCIFTSISHFYAYICIFFFSAIFCLVAIIVYAVLYGKYYSKNILSRHDIDQGFKSETKLDYSYYLVVAATACHVTNLVMLLASGVKCGLSMYKEG